MSLYESLHPAADRVTSADASARNSAARKVVLFGSYARSTRTADSDVDVRSVMPFEGRSVDKSVEIRLKTNPPLNPLDLLVRTPEVVRQRIKIGRSCFLRDILRDGKVLV